MMRTVLFLVTSSDVGGAERVLIEVIGALRGVFQCEVCVLGENPQLVRLMSQRCATTPVSELGIWPLESGGAIGTLAPDLGGRPVMSQRPLRGAAVLWRTIQALRSKRLQAMLAKAHIVCASNQVPFLLAAVARLVLRIEAQIIWHEHTFQRSAVRQLLVDVLVRLSGARVISVSRAVARQHLRWAAASTRVVWNGFEIEKAPKSDVMRRGLARKAGLRGEFETLVVMPSMFRFWKGHDVALKAFSLLRRRQIEKVRLVLLGGPVAGDNTYARCVEVIKANGLEGYVGMAGACDNVPELIGGAADMVLVPSVVDDPLPTVVIEAISQSVAVVASDCGGIPEILGGVSRSRLFRPGDVSQCADAIMELAEADTQAAHSNGRRLYEERFQGARFAEAIRNVFAEASTISSAL